MDNIFEQLLFTTLRIECLDYLKNVIGIGTGFLIQRPIGEDACKIYLVSNKHVLCNANSITVSFTKQKNEKADLGNILKLTIENTKNSVIPHPNPEADVAIIDCTGIFANAYPNELYVQTVPYDMLATFEEPELNVAENIFFVGYPNDRYDIKNNLPLIRSSMIASHPKFNYNGEPIFIIDAQVFPGSSGSPVYIDLTYENIKNGKITLGIKEIKLLGIVSSTMIRNNRLKAIQTSHFEVCSEEVLGLGIVFKSTLIKELIDSAPK